MAGKNGAPSAAARAKSNNSTRSKQRPKKTQTDVSSKSTSGDQTNSVDDRNRQQRVLEVFRRTFSEVLSSPSFTATLQSVKQALFDRDFARAFGDPDYLAVYAARWSPTRALCYAYVLSGICEHLEPLSWLSPRLNILDQPEDKGTLKVDDCNCADNNVTTIADIPQQLRHLKVLSIGGGAAELVAFGAFLSSSESLSGSITLLDSGPWATVVSDLTASLTTPPPLSKYASEAAKLSNTATVSPSRFASTFIQRDVLALGRERLSSLVGNQPLLVTLLFTLNELFTASGIGRTTIFLLDLTSVIPAGSLLLVVDSPGSYSETSVGKEAKRYPMHWLLDRIMLGTRREPVNGRRWAKLESQDSVWFRLAAADMLDYPIPLENMRYQMHLYKAEDASNDEEED
ncbi:hypothetical protein VTK56DRAFT_3241 [Thermocarpiscus australiensis]